MGRSKRLPKIGRGVGPGGSRKAFFRDRNHNLWKMQLTKINSPTVKDETVAYEDVAKVLKQNVFSMLDWGLEIGRE